MAVFVLLLSPYSLLVAIGLFFLVPFFHTNKALARVPGPLAAKFTNFWLLLQARKGRRYLSVHEAHARHGPLVRIAPNHVSVADDAAIPTIYGHGNGFLKSDFYDAFVTLRRGLFTTRDRAEHTRKRKTISHTFSAKSVGQFETHMAANLAVFVKQWDALAETAQGRFATLDCLHWFNYLAFDIIGDLAFGAPFGMLERGEDLTEIQLTPGAPVTRAPAVTILNQRGEVAATLGCLPQLKPFARYLPDPFFHKGAAAVNSVTGMAVARVSQRLDGKDHAQRTDLLARLMESRDESGQKLGREELTTEALTQLVAGSDTTSNTSCAILFWILRTPRVLTRLQAELRRAIPADLEIPSFETVKDLPYLHNVIQEALRLHTPSSVGLPRVVPSGAGVTIRETHFPPGTVLSVPAYTIHHSLDIWGPDAAAFVPERWERLGERQKNAFIPFSYGPRSCVGRNVAEMELALIIGTVVNRYDFELYQDELQTREGFLRKPLACNIGIKRRAAVEGRD